MNTHSPLSAPNPVATAPITTLSAWLVCPALKVPAPEALTKSLLDCAAAAKTPAQAQAALDLVLPALMPHAPAPPVAIACGMLVEKLRQQDGMRAMWATLAQHFPADATALRMLMRWYRRDRLSAAGAAHLHALYPDPTAGLAQAQCLALGYNELWDDAAFDALMAVADRVFFDTDVLRLLYLQALDRQGRFADVLVVASQLIAPDAVPPARQNQIARARHNLDRMCLYHLDDARDVMGRMVSHYAPIRPARRTNSGTLGAIALYNGQLGMGGAERQITRIAAALQTLYAEGTATGGRHLSAPPQVCVAHVTAATNADFFLPVMQTNNVATTVLAQTPDPGMHSLHDVPAIITDLYDLLPPDVQVNTRKLVRFFRDHKIEVAYLWQDGGVMNAALAAVIAGVPRIVTSFRGMPPNMRPRLFRPQMAALNRALYALPGVTLTTNSARTAHAYAAWLELPQDAIAVIPNAVLPLPTEGGAAEQQIWADIQARSPDCTRTVLGVFRYDDNKRPGLWIDAAAAYATAHPDTRFVLVGRGSAFDACTQRVRQAGAQDRVFLVGGTEHVGFYMERADLLMHLARMEGLPNVLIEAHYCGLPVLATPAGGSVEVFIQGESGHFLPDADNLTLDQVLDGLTDLLGDHDRLAHMGANAITTARRKYDMQRVIDQTLTLFDT